MGTLLDVAALVVDCPDSDVLGRFYQRACGGELSSVGDAAALRLSGLLVIFRKVDDYRAPQWPGSAAPMQGHFDFLTDDLAATESALHALGATTADHQHHRDDGLVVMLDPAGHPFCIGTR